MKSMHVLLNQKVATNTAKFMKIVCYIIIALFILMLVISFCGRLQYVLDVEGKIYESAIYAEENHDYTTRGFTVTSKDSLRVHSSADNGKINLKSYIAIVIVFALNIIPLIFAFWYLSKVFDNVAKGEIFVEKNASYLLYYGIISAAVAVIVPFVKLFIVQIANTFIPDRISLATGMNMINQIIPSIAFLVAAYIINYGVHLQDEVDHTL
ncbi:MAG: DUF2975 domain-containing protein [Oscillospiraceae bacterium]